MRSPILGATIDDIERLRTFVRASTLLTHTDPKAFYGAFAVALAAWCSKRGLDSPVDFFGRLRSALPDISEEFGELMGKVEASAAAGESTELFAERLGCGRGVSGYVYRTVPVVLHCWLRHPRDFRSAIDTVVRCGGDTDSTAAIVGAIVGSGVGRAGIPSEWIEGLWEWPRSVMWMEHLAEAVAGATETGMPVKSPRVIPLVGLARNAVFFGIVFGHVLRRLLPPY